MAALQALAVAFGSFRADDWTNLAHGHWALTPAGRLAVWTRLNPFTLYRPLVDYWHGTMLAVFGLHPRPMLAVMVLLFAFASALLYRFARERGAGRPAAALAAAAVWAQPNTYSWTTLWASNVTGSLMTLASLGVLIQHHRAVRHAERGRSPVPAQALMLALFVAGALCKEEIVLLPGALIVLEALRAPFRTAPARAVSRRGTLALLLLAGAYAYFRTHVLVTSGAGNRYQLTLGPHVFTNLRFFAMHLGAMPIVTGLLALLLLPAIRERATWRGPGAGEVKREALAALLWAAVALLLYLPIHGRPAYGYLYLPAFALAYGVARVLSHAAARARVSPATAARVVGGHAALAALLTAWGLLGVQWPRYGLLTRRAFATLDQAMPVPPRNALVVFVDPGAPETTAGRTIFNLIFDGATGDMLRLHYGRDDLRGLVVTDPATIPADAAIVFEARGGRLKRFPTAADTSTTPRSTP